MTKTLIISLAVVTAYATAITPLAYVEAKRRTVSFVASLPAVTDEVMQAMQQNEMRVMAAAIPETTLVMPPPHKPRRSTQND